MIDENQVKRGFKFTHCGQSNRNGWTGEVIAWNSHGVDTIYRFKNVFQNYTWEWFLKNVIEYCPAPEVKDEPKAFYVVFNGKALPTVKHTYRQQAIDEALRLSKKFTDQKFTVYKVTDSEFSFSYKKLSRYSQCINTSYDTGKGYEGSIDEIKSHLATIHRIVNNMA